MKRLIVMFLICVAGLIACNKKAIPSDDAKNASKASNKTNEVADNGEYKTNTSATTTPSFNDMKGSQTVIPDAPKPVSLDQGKTVFLSKCGNCHALKKISDYTPGQWKDILKAEIPRAKLSNEESDQVTAFIMAKANK